MYLALAAAGRQAVSVLDRGGGPGHYLVLSEALLPGTAIDYHSRDVPRLAELGRELLPRGTFWSDDCCLDRTYDLVLASGLLQYAERWEETLRALAGATGRYLFVTRLPVALASPSFVVVQRPHAVGY